MSKLAFYLKICDGKNFSCSTTNDKQNFYLTANLKGDPIESIQKTDLIPACLEPKWNQEFVFNCKNPASDVVYVNMFQTSADNININEISSNDENERIIDPLRFPVKDFPIGFRRIWSEDVKRKKSIVGHLTLEIEVKNIETPTNSTENSVNNFSTPKKKQKNKKSKTEKKSKTDKKSKTEKHRKDKNSKNKSPKDKSPKDKSLKERSSDSKNKQKRSNNTKFKTNTANFDPKYNIYIKVSSGKGLPQINKDELLDPYVVFQVEGSSLIAMSKPVLGTQNPIWDDLIKMNGYFLGSDLLHIWVYDRKKVVDLEKNDCVGYNKIFISDLKLGEIQNIEMPLFTVINKCNIIDRNSKPGDAGILSLSFHIAQFSDQPFIQNPFMCTFYQAWIEFIDINNCPNVENSHTNPYIVAKIDPAANGQRQRTSTKENTIHPVWNERHCFLLDDIENQSLSVHMLYENPDENEDTKVCKLRIPLKSYSCNDPTEETKQMKGINFNQGCQIHYRITLVRKGDFPFTENESSKSCKVIKIQKNEKEKKQKIKKQLKKQNKGESSSSSSNSSSISQDSFDFSLGSYSSLYSSSFEGYTSNSESLSSISTDEENAHKNHNHKDSITDNVKVKWSTQSLSITLNYISHLYNFERVYTTFNVFSKDSIKSRKIIRSNSVKVSKNKAKFNQKLSFEKLKKGFEIEISCFEESSENKIGVVRFPIKNLIPNSNQDISLNLKNESNENSGRISLSLFFNVNYRY
ncbi:hypothetical protein TRFO_27987 [Tritrichomonas foetus]|uniref:C2 domain-containing protein n=1 Tax=Tritrichomonas foetus TaxID=1144522 RepID=A0A1J4K174_9EUKA|nr:hypothetical protein TRFO_27987 [Tritrichomonas foetus]|eukprot:OHT04536.1 hypothetical protein TRFO_27987 [Tritrichomonas foetus]